MNRAIAVQANMFIKSGSSGEHQRHGKDFVNACSVAIVLRMRSA